MDEIAPELNEEVIAQVGNRPITTKNIKLLTHVKHSEFETLFNSASLVVSHAGMGTILTSLKLKKNLIIFPRLQQFCEHRNDHQLATAKHLASLYNIQVATNKEEILAGIEVSRSQVEFFDLKFQERDKFIDNLRTQINSFLGS
jgi:UDP-N-acetylglucosamine transferase subunit ALG13